MATPSPGHRLRTKTSDITDFFRTGHSSRSRADADEPGPSSPAFLAEPESPVRKRSSKIPFLGRQRKKSTHSDASTSASSAGPSSRQSDSEVRHSNASKQAEPRPNVPAVPLVDESAERPLPAVPTTTFPSPSLGSKLAAHFAPSRQKLLNLSPRKPTRPPTNEYTSDTLSPPIPVSRGASIDSTSSENRSTTPRPSQPVITVSLPPDNLEGYEGMFTLPTSSSSNVGRDPQLTPTATSPLRFPTPQPSDSQPDTTIKRRSSRSTADERSSSRASRISRKHIGTTSRPFEVDSTDAEDSEAIMSDSPKPSPPMTAGPTPIVEKRRTLATMPYTFLEKASQPRSIMKHSSDRPPRPPTFPPPPPPTNPPPSSALPVIPSSPTTASRKSNGSPPLGSSASRRQRAQTLSAVPSPHITFSPPSASLSITPARRIAKSIGEGSAPTSTLAKKTTEEPSGKENLDMEKASADQLRQALTLRNQQFDELASYLLKITEAHVAEKHALLKKVASLEQEATRRENEIKGLTWLVTNAHNTRPGMGMLPTASRSTSALELDAKQPSGAKLASSFSHSNPSEDSGAESHQTTSGAESYREESLWGSGTSGGESSSSDRARKVKRNYTLMSSFYRTSLSTKSARPGEPAGPMILPYSPSPSTKRSSISSFGTSPSSSTSSLSLSTLTPATTVTSLSAIPETLAPAPSSKDPVVAAAILAAENQREKEERKEERRANRASNRVSASSVTAPSTSASASYSANLKRARPPSIAQVLAQSPKMEHGRDKLRMYGTSGSASS